MFSPPATSWNGTKLGRSSVNEQKVDRNRFLPAEFAEGNGPNRSPTRLANPEPCFPLYLQVLEEAGIWKQIRRVAGANSGAVMAALLGVGYSGAELRRHFTNDQKIVFQGTGSRPSFVPSRISCSESKLK